MENEPAYPDVELREGRTVRVRRIEETPADWCEGEIIMASGNGRSIAIRLEGVIRAGAGIILGVGLFSIDPENERVTALMAPDSDEYEIEVLTFEYPALTEAIEFRRRAGGE